MSDTTPNHPAPSTAYPTQEEIRAALDWAIDEAAAVEDDDLASVFRFLEILHRQSPAEVPCRVAAAGRYLDQKFIEDVTEAGRTLRAIGRDDLADRVAEVTLVLGRRNAWHQRDLLAAAKALAGRSHDGLADVLREAARRLSAEERDAGSRCIVTTPARPGSQEHGIDPRPKEYFAGISDSSEMVIWSEDAEDAAELDQVVAEYIAEAVRADVERIA